MKNLCQFQFCLPFPWRSTLKGKNLLPKEHVFPFSVHPILIGKQTGIKSCSLCKNSGNLEGYCWACKTSVMAIGDQTGIACVHRVEISPPVFASCRDCLSYLASTETVRDLLLRSKTTIRKRMASNQDCSGDFASCRKHTHTDRHGRKPFITYSSRGRNKKRWRTVSAEAKYDGQS